MAMNRLDTKLQYPMALFEEFMNFCPLGKKSPLVIEFNVTYMHINRFWVKDNRRALNISYLIQYGIAFVYDCLITSY